MVDVNAENAVPRRHHRQMPKKTLEQLQGKRSAITTWMRWLKAM
jgi:hypothetical protein